MKITRRNFLQSAAAAVATALVLKPDGHKTKYQDIRTEIDAFAKKLNRLAQRKALTNNSSINKDDFMNLIDNLPLAKKAFLQFEKDYPKFIAKNPALDAGNVFKTFLNTYNIYLDTFYAEQA
jgi:hypothetical protein